MRFVRGTASVLLPGLALLALAGCGDDDSPGAAVDTPSPTATTSTTSSDSPSPSPSPSGTLPSPSAPMSTFDQAAVIIAATVADGKINPSTRTIKAKQGQKVLVTVTSDQADELHIHGYDKEVELQPGKPGSVTFTADTKGTFEIETHESGKLVAKLIVE